MWGRWDIANKYHWHVFGLLTIYGPYWVCPSSWWHVLSWSTLLRFPGTLQGQCPKWALHFIHFLGLSLAGSGSWVLCKDTGSVGHAFSAFSRSEHLRKSGDWQAQCLQWAMNLHHLPGPGSLVSWVSQKSTVSVRCAMCLL